MTLHYPTQTATLAAGVASSIDLPVGGFRRCTLVIKNTGASNAIGTVTVDESPNGTLFGRDAAIGTAIGSIAAEGLSLVVCDGLACHTLRINLTSSSGSAVSIEAIMEEEGASARVTRVNGTMVGAPSVTGDFTATNITATTDLAAAGGFKRNVGPFNVTLAADQTSAATTYGNVSGAAWVAPRAGSVTAATAQISAAITGAATSATARVFKNGTLLNAAFDLAFTQAGAEVLDYALVAKDTYTFVAGDLIRVVYTSTTITNTPTMVVTLEVEC